jgi:protein MpaA
MKILSFALLFALCSCSILDKWVAQDSDSDQKFENKSEPLEITTEQEAPLAEPNIEELAIVEEVMTDETPVLLEDFNKHSSVTPQINKHCLEIDRKFYSYKWSESHCHRVNWNHVRNSVESRPLIWKVFGEEKTGNNVTMILCGVHGDEITPIKFCFDILKDLIDNPLDMKDQTLVLVPLVNPDSFLKEMPTRTNANGVDVNRNLPTKDWDREALSTWKNRYGSNPRRYPGKKSLSEPETLFQVNLIKRYQPHKIISVHAPLTLLDYDGPRLAGKTTISLGEKLLKTMSKKAYNYKIRNYPFFPGSLGNYAGSERNIPTYTLELPNSDPARSQEFWDVFRDAIRDAIKTDFRSAEQEKFLLTPVGSQ